MCKDSFKFVDLTQGIGAFERSLKNLDIESETVLRLLSERSLENEAYRRLNPLPLEEIYPRELEWENRLATNWKQVDVDLAGITFDISKNYLKDDEIRKKIEIALVIKPKAILFDLNKSFLSTKHKHEFEMIFAELELAGYQCFYRQINAYRLASPQWRERSYMVAFRDDIIEHRRFRFPKTFNSVLTINDMVSDTVDKKYYLSEEEHEKILGQMNESEKLSCCYPQLHLDKFVVGNCSKKTKRVNNSVKGRIYSIQGLIGSLEWKGAIKSVPKIVKLNCKDINPLVFKDSTENPKILRGRVLEQVLNGNYENYNSLDIIRRLTPREVWKLNGYTDLDFDKVKSELTDLELYQLCGSIMIYPLDEILLRVVSFIEGCVE